MPIDACDWFLLQYTSVYSDKLRLTFCVGSVTFGLSAPPSIVRKAADQIKNTLEKQAGTGRATKLARRLIFDWFDIWPRKSWNYHNS